MRTQLSIKIQLLLCLLLGLPFLGKAQERIAQSCSISAGHLLTKGFHLTGHYHLNGFDEMRLGFSTNITSLPSDNPEEPASLKTPLWHLAYAKGFRVKQSQLSSIGFYVGSGLVIGTEKPSIVNTIEETGAGGKEKNEQQIVGLEIFTELEVAIAKKGSLFLRLGKTVIFTQHIGKHKELAIGFRYYF